MDRRNENSSSFLKDKVLNQYRESGKKHLLITGSKGIGKSTLIKEILKSEYSYGGIITRLIRDVHGHSSFVLLEDALDRNRVTKIGVINSSGTAMNPIIEGFEGLGSEILSSYRKSSKEFIVFDEIGYIESQSERYRQEIHLCFHEKRVIAALRKSDNPFIKEIRSERDSLLIDLDEYNLHRRLV